MSEIIDYQASFSFETRKGYINFGYSDGSWTDWITFLNFDEYRAVLDILRNEKPIFYDGSEIYTGPEPVGDGDKK